MKQEVDHIYRDLHNFAPEQSRLSLNKKIKSIQQKKNNYRIRQLSRQNISKQIISRQFNFFETEYFRFEKKNRDLVNNRPPFDIYFRIATPILKKAVVALEF